MTVRSFQYSRNLLTKTPFRQAQFFSTGRPNRKQKPRSGVMFTLSPFCHRFFYNQPSCQLVLFLALNALHASLAGEIGIPMVLRQYNVNYEAMYCLFPEQPGLTLVANGTQIDALGRIEPSVDFPKRSNNVSLACKRRCFIL